MSSKQLNIIVECQNEALRKYAVYLIQLLVEPVMANIIKQSQKPCPKVCKSKCVPKKVAKKVQPKKAKLSNTSKATSQVSKKKFEKTKRLSAR